MRLASLAVALVLVGCGSGAQHGGNGLDLSIGDLATPDLATPTACAQTDPMTDGTPCSAGCPAGTIGVNLPDNSCKCLATCTTNTSCPCDRFCDTLTRPDAGVVGQACLVGNDPGERCGRDANGAPFYNLFCDQLTVCVNADAAKLFRYCNYFCNTQPDCPAQTTCQPLFDPSGNPIGNVCAYNSGPNGNKDLGQTCTPSDTCKTGQLCDGVCRAQCDGPGGTCASGTCTRLDDPASGKVIGYVCK